jgi:hypothetical protein
MKFYDRIYGESPEAIKELQDKLESLGYLHISKAPHNEKVIGHVPVKRVDKTPYLDNLSYKIGTASFGRYVGEKVI